MGGLLKGAIAGAVGGAIGAAIWAIIVYQFHYEIGWIAWGVGILAGLGVQLGAQKDTNALTGLVAVVIAVASIMAGKFMAVSAMVDDAARTHFVSGEVTEEMAIGYLARQVAEEYQRNGKAVNWPEGEEPFYPTDEDEFPADVWGDAKARWQKADAGWRDSHTQWAREMHKHESQEMIGIAKGIGFIASFGLFDILFFGLAIFSAYGLGSGAGGSSE